MAQVWKRVGPKEWRVEITDPTDQCPWGLNTLHDPAYTKYAAMSALNRLQVDMELPGLGQSFPYENRPW